MQKKKFHRRALVSEKRISYHMLTGDTEFQGCYGYYYYYYLWLFVIPSTNRQSEELAQFFLCVGLRMKNAVHHFHPVSNIKLLFSQCKEWKQVLLALLLKRKPSIKKENKLFLYHFPMVHLRGYKDDAKVGPDRRFFHQADHPPFPCLLQLTFTAAI